MTINEKLNAARAGVVVLCGGPGNEREVSLVSGENVHQALNRAGLENELVRVPEDNPQQVLENLICRVAVMMFHGEFGEDGTAQSILERRGITFTGSDSQACSLAMDKNATKELFVKYGIPTARWALGDTPAGLAAAVRKAGLSYPLFAKPNHGGSSVGVSRVNRPEELEQAANGILTMDHLVLAEEMVVGRELTVGWLDGRVLPIIELLADGDFYDYQAKYHSDATRYICPADLAPELTQSIQRYTARIVEIIGSRDLARVDMMFGPDGPRFLEINSLPGFTSHSLVPMAAGAIGISMEKLCLSLVGMAASRIGITAERLFPPPVGLTMAGMI
ncbi:MAG: D-alanine--D-alanine ligase [Planctomycetes bacterium]|nr:D-alanine--D-alanine ligase [Planctomycetota bacterium]